MLIGVAALATRTVLVEQLQAQAGNQQQAGEGRKTTAKGWQRGFHGRVERLA